ncbi:hydroxyisourate hydrolase [Cryobacterium melibiosiphilum]|uniref:5-hydroxyisourate hydrolase n=1 Tax=Cryobacterium melibiosiphilum TaxID=995039 RepID=A0A3A5MQ70_9MICO|nr:hydroxyisourate hydrolase [Cryobacterium melibiosiphilum]RJT88216.1 hydroxyisourate hydrolase [Cryobacterium melibiosiphilum]
MSARSAITTHVLDAVTGRPAVGVPVSLEQLGATDGTTTWVWLASGVTDADGRLADLGPAALAPGRYRVVFDTGSFFARTATPTLYPEVIVSIELPADPALAHVHVPLLLSPFAYSTYRGS